VVKSGYHKARNADVAAARIQQRIAPARTAKPPAKHHRAPQRRVQGFLRVLSALFECFDYAINKKDPERSET
jgi:hypothetical protein